MVHKLFCRKTNRGVEMFNRDLEFQHGETDRINELNTTSLGFNSLDSIIENEIKRFHNNIKRDIIAIYNLSREVFYKHNHTNPELAKLSASLFLFFSDIMYYINIEEQLLIPAIRDMLKEKEQSAFLPSDAKQVIWKLIQKIRFEHHEVVKKLIYFKTLTTDYKVPVGACNSYQLLFSKMKKFKNELIGYIQFENRRFFPRALAFGNNFKELCCQL